MKTTNYEISKQLAEAKFKANQVWNQEGKFWGYDLETILEVLPDLIRSPDSPPHLCNPLFVSKKGVGYDYASGLTSIREENESLADVAAKMWLKLKENNLI